MNIPLRYRLNTSSFQHYWQDGVGKELLAGLAAQPSLDDADQFIPYLMEYDRAGDKLVEDLQREDIAIGQYASLVWNHFDGKDTSGSAAQQLQAFIAAIDLQPAWLDMKRVACGQELCQRAGLTALIVLRDYSLMGGYESAAINKPLIYTGALKRGAVKRLTDTVEFWVQINKPGGLALDSEGLKQVFLTRLIHSFSRQSILKHSDWDNSKWGMPLNTWDMLATMLGFSMVFLVGLRRMGMQPRQDEVDGLFHMWKYVGYLLGIPIQLIPETEEQAIIALYYWTMTQADGDADSKALAKALKEEPLLAKHPKSGLMRKMMHEVHLYYNQFLLGKYSCDLLGLPQTTIGRFAVINIWKTKALEKNMDDPTHRDKIIKQGALEQENVRQIYQEYYN